MNKENYTLHTAQHTLQTAHCTPHNGKGVYSEGLFLSWMTGGKWAEEKHRQEIQQLSGDTWTGNRNIHCRQKITGNTTIQIIQVDGNINALYKLKR